MSIASPGFRRRAMHRAALRQAPGWGRPIEKLPGPGTGRARGVTHTSTSKLGDGCMVGLSIHHLRNAWPVAPLFLLIAGCTAGNGEGLDAGGRPITGPPLVNSDFQEIQDTIFTPICTACHVGANAPRGLRLDAANSYAMLVNVASAEVPGTLRVNPGNPDASYIVQKIEGIAAVGVRMPAN